jgi:hypothetical protein
MIPVVSSPPAAERGQVGELRRRPHVRSDARGPVGIGDHDREVAVGGPPGEVGAAGPGGDASQKSWATGAVTRPVEPAVRLYRVSCAETPTSRSRATPPSQASTADRGAMPTNTGSPVLLAAVTRTPPTSARLRRGCPQDSAPPRRRDRDRRPVLPGEGPSGSRTAPGRSVGSGAAQPRSGCGGSGSSPERPTPCSVSTVSRMSRMIASTS